MAPIFFQSSSVESDISTRLQDTNISADAEETDNKSSRAEKRRAKRAAKEQERERRIAEAEIDNVNCARNVEAEKLKNILCERNLQIFEVIEKLPSSLNIFINICELSW
jgi:OTU domain-containing protein 6